MSDPVTASSPPHVTCPRCFTEVVLADTVRFCPHCGFRGIADAAKLESQPHDIHVDGRTITVLDRLALGSVCNLYRCIVDGDRSHICIFKIARDAIGNRFVEREAFALQRLAQGIGAKEFWPFVPRIVHNFAHRGGNEPARRVNVIAYDGAIRSPDELYSLDEVLAVYPNGLDARDMAWIWRRLLTVLDFAHANNLAHGAVLPMHVLIDPRDHKLVLIDWCQANLDPTSALDAKASATGAGEYRWWYLREISRGANGFAQDLAHAARTMIRLVGGDPTTCDVPTTVDQAIARHLSRVAETSPRTIPIAGRVLKEFDQLIETLWGKRTFRVFPMPERAPRTV